MGIKCAAWAAAAALLAAVVAPSAWSENSIAPGASARLIIQLRPAATAALATNQRQAQAAKQAEDAKAPDRVRRLAERSALRLGGLRELGNGMVAVSLRAALAGGRLEETLATLRADPDVEFAEVDQRRYIRALPNDPLHVTNQWYQQAGETSAANFTAAWDTTTGDAGTVIAVLDTGIYRDHPDLAGRVLPGYDFVSGESGSSFVSANDDDDWDEDASDPGDWVTSAESLSGPLDGCRVEPSSWHGTRVAAMIGATTNNGTGIAGGTWNGNVLPVRVLGKCGGYDSDIIAGMRWAAGLPVAGVPANPNPAKILNMSLGGGGNCSSAYRNAVAAVSAAGGLVVAAGGNGSGPVGAPANCPGTLAVAGLRHVGTKVGYSSFGPEVGISAPAGNCPSTPLLCEYALITATNAGPTVPTTSTYTTTTDNQDSIGTSFSAPIVAAIAGLMTAVNGGLTPEELTARIKNGARPFPAPQVGLPTCPNLDSATGQCNCTTSTCGAGMADAPGALAEALRPMARIAAPGGSGAGQNVTLDGSASDAASGRTLSSYSWSAVSGSPVFLGPTTGATAAVAVPPTGLVMVRLQVTDDAGRTDAQEVALGSTSSSGGGGGGMAHPLVLLALGLLAARRRRVAGKSC